MYCYQIKSLSYLPVCLNIFNVSYLVYRASQKVTHATFGDISTVLAIFGCIFVTVKQKYTLYHQVLLTHI